MWTTEELLADAIIRKRLGFAPGPVIEKNAALQAALNVGSSLTQAGVTVAK